MKIPRFARNDIAGGGQKGSEEKRFCVFPPIPITKNKTVIPNEA
jgi:hypothetical protein